MNADLVHLAMVVFFGATVVKDAQFWPNWLRITRLVAGVVLALNALVELL